MAIAFNWETKDILDLLSSCERDGLLPYILQYVKKEDVIIESGCGLARWVKKLSNMGYNCYGIEYSRKTVKNVKEIWPELDLLVGTILQHPFKSNSCDVLISLGVVENFENGPMDALSDIFRILKPGGIGIITVPCLNGIRRIKHPFTPDKLICYSHEGEHNRERKFFEYRFSPDFFQSVVRSIGFEIIEQKPFAHIDGFYHDLDPLHLFVKFHNWKFEPEDVVINRILSKIPYFHCHMQIIIVRKPLISRNNGIIPA